MNMKWHPILKAWWADGEDLSQQFAVCNETRATQDANYSDKQFTGVQELSSDDGLVFCAGTGTAWY